MLSLTFLIGFPVLVSDIPASPRRHLRPPTIPKDPTPTPGIRYVETVATACLVAQRFTLRQTVASPAPPSDDGVLVRATARAQVSVAGRSW